MCPALQREHPRDTMAMQEVLGVREGVVGECLFSKEKMARALEARVGGTGKQMLAKVLSTS